MNIVLTFVCGLVEIRSLIVAHFPQSINLIENLGNTASRVTSSGTDLFWRRLFTKSLGSALENMLHSNRNSSGDLIVLQFPRISIVIINSSNIGVINCSSTESLVITFLTIKGGHPLKPLCSVILNLTDFINVKSLSQSQQSESLRGVIDQTGRPQSFNAV